MRTDATAGKDVEALAAPGAAPISARRRRGMARRAGEVGMAREPGDFLQGQRVLETRPAVHEEEADKRQRPDEISEAGAFGVAEQKPDEAAAAQGIRR